MQSLTDIMDRIHRSEDFDIHDLETIVGEQIAVRSGARRGTVPGLPGLGVQRVPLGPNGASDQLQSAVDWIARRIRQDGHGVFNVSVRRQPTSLILVAEWVRAFTTSPAPGEKVSSGRRAPNAKV